MPDGLDDLLGNDSTNGSDNAPGGQLRKQLEKVLADNKALSEQLASLQADSRSRAVKELAAKHAIPELALDFFPKDAALTDESATSFVEKYGQLWGAQAATATTPEPQQQAAAAMQQFASQASPPPVAPLSEEQYRAKFAEASTRAEVLQMLAELGGGVGMGE